MMKRVLENFLSCLFFAALIAVIVFLLNLSTGLKYDEKLAGKSMTVSWKYVNFREDHSTDSEIITRLWHGTEVELTGNTYMYGGDMMDTSYWFEVRFENNIGWVVSVSLGYLP